jgi:hypothetical protein
MKPGRERLFLERVTYRRRRLMDAARVLPYLGGFLFLAPILFAPKASTVAGFGYIFGIWLALIVVAGVIASRLAGGRSGDSSDDGDA